VSDDPPPSAVCPYTTPLLIRHGEDRGIAASFSSGPEASAGQRVAEKCRSYGGLMRIDIILSVSHLQFASRLAYTQVKKESVVSFMKVL
jgi:hypothetical protein